MHHLQIDLFKINDRFIELSYICHRHQMATTFYCITFFGMTYIAKFDLLATSLLHVMFS